MSETDNQQSHWLTNKWHIEFIHEKKSYNVNKDKSW